MEFLLLVATVFVVVIVCAVVDEGAVSSQTLRRRSRTQIANDAANPHTAKELKFDDSEQAFLP